MVHLCFEREVGSLSERGQFFFFFFFFFVFFFVWFVFLFLIAP